MKFGVGQSVRRREDVRLVTGQGRYTDDIKPANEAHAYFVRSPHPHAVIKSIDVEAVRQAPGVIGVLTADDLGDTGTMPVRGVFKNRDGSNIKQSPKALLPKDKVRFPGEAVADGRGRERPPSPRTRPSSRSSTTSRFPPRQRSKTAAAGAEIWDDAPGNLVFDWGEGNEAACNAAFAGAAKTVAVELVQNRVVASPMEPRGAIGLYDAGSRSLHALHLDTGAKHDPRSHCGRASEDPAAEASRRLAGCRRRLRHEGNGRCRAGACADRGEAVWPARQVDRRTPRSVPRRWARPRRQDAGRARARQGRAHPRAAGSRAPPIWAPT